MAKLEIACFNKQSAVIAQSYGADRIEFCSGFEVGGTTPNVLETSQLLSEITIPIFVMIRPRGGNFCYTDEEFQSMKNSIEAFKKLKVSGFVFGILHQDRTVDIIRNKELVALSKPFPCTFHRAFDEVPNIETALEAVISCNFDAVLTSGTKPNAVEGATQLKTLIAQSKNRITIMPGGGLRSSNLKNLHQELQTTYYHSSAITATAQTANGEEIKALKLVINE